jgi:hypothetical protein
MDPPMNLRIENSRQWIRYPNHLQIFCERFTFGEPDHGIWATAQNLSRGGILLTLDDRVGIGEYFIIELPSACLFARVVRVAHESDGRWLAGCRFTRLLSEAELQAAQEDQGLRSAEDHNPPWVRAAKSIPMP